MRVDSHRPSAQDRSRVARIEEHSKTAARARTKPPDLEDAQWCESRRRSRRSAAASRSRRRLVTANSWRDLAISDSI